MTFDMKNFIAEIGVNHEGSVEKAKLMIDQCKACGVGVVKFQSYTAEKLAAEHSPAYWDLSKEPTSNQRELFARNDSFKLADYTQIASYCREVGIEFLTTPFDEEWVEALDPLLSRYKVASVDLTNYLLLEAIAKKRKPIILSVGAASLAEIDAALDYLRQKGAEDITLLHCIINYPTDLANAGLGQIFELRRRYADIRVGYSDHTVPSDSFTALPLAVSLGATVIEKHYTFDRTLPGNDHYHAFDFEGLYEFSSLISQVNRALESADLATQDAGRRFARRGLYAAKPLVKGHVIERSDLMALRPMLNFLSPSKFESVVGKTLLNDVGLGEGISVNDLRDLHE